MFVLNKQTIEKQDFSIFLRDLASTLNINLKHMIEDNIKDSTTTIKKNKDYNKKKKIVPKKKDIIIQEQNKKREKSRIDNDLKKIEFLSKSFDHKNPFEPLQKLSTNEGKLQWKLNLLEEFWKNKKKYINFIILLYFELKDTDCKLLPKVEKIILNYDCKLFMMKELGHMLPPLNQWERSFRKFDDWQEKTIRLIHNKENIIVKAPTSSGKSFIAMAAGILHKKVLYICPAKPVVYQVGSHFTHMGYRVHFLVDNLSHYSYDSRTNIFIGTPKEIETNIIKIGTHFDYVVYDEIHNLNKEDDGDSYENLIKLIKCPFLALSATIENITDLQTFFGKIYENRKIHLIEYEQRFINHQRWIWKDKLIKLHPLCAYNSIEDINNNISFTPNDCSTLWECIDTTFEAIDQDTDLLDGCSPDEYFQEDRLLSLDDCKEYEYFLKDKLKEWNENYPDKVQLILDSFKEEPCQSDNSNNIIDFIKSARDNDMFPMIMFHTNELICKSIFYNLYESLNEKELEEFPYHYEILEKKEELYQSYRQKRDTFKDGIKIKSTNPEYEIKEKLIVFDRKEKDNYIFTMNCFFEQKMNQIKNNTIEDQKKKKQINNLKKEINHFLQNPDFHSHDIFQKHKDFIFTNSCEPMSGDTIRNVRREILKTLGIKIPYESPLFQLLKRGIGIYIENMPDEYNWILQKLLSKKEIGIVISDKTLCLGIDLPVRSSCFLGMNNPNFTKDDYLQMSGRAGRRGMDTKGNIIFYGNIDYLSLMKDNLPKLIGNINPINDNYKILNQPEVFDNLLNPNRKIISIDNYHNIEEKKLVWNLRKYESAIQFTKNLKVLEKELFMKHESDRPLYLLSKIDKLLQKGKVLEEFKLKKIIDETKINLIKEYINVFIHIHNSLHPQKYIIIRKNLVLLFDIFNKIVFNYII